MRSSFIFQRAFNILISLNFGMICLRVAFVILIIAIHIIIINWTSHCRRCRSGNSADFLRMINSDPRCQRAVLIISPSGTHLYLIWIDLQDIISLLIQVYLFGHLVCPRSPFSTAWLGWQILIVFIGVARCFDVGARQTEGLVLASAPDFKFIVRIYLDSLGASDVTDDSSALCCSCTNWVLSR